MGRPAAVQCSVGAVQCSVSQCRVKKLDQAAFGFDQPLPGSDGALSGFDKAASGCLTSQQLAPHVGGTASAGVQCDAMHGVGSASASGLRWFSRSLVQWLQALCRLVV